MFVTSVITNQVMKLKLGEADRIIIGNVDVFRDWSHVMDVVRGYCLLAEKGNLGDVYNQGSMRTNSVLSYILLSLKHAGWEVERIKTMKNDKSIEEPARKEVYEMFGTKFEMTKVDKLLLQDEIEFTIEDKGIWVYTNKGKIQVEFDSSRFRYADVPILMSDTRKMQDLGFGIQYSLEDIIKDQLNHFEKRENRV